MKICTSIFSRLSVALFLLTITTAAKAQLAPVAGLHVDSTTINSIAVSWEYQANVLSWNVEYGIHGFAEGSGTRVSVARTSITIPNLTGQTRYDIYVSANYGASGISRSVMVEATTLFEPYPLPFRCNFENASVNRDWTISSGTSANQWLIGHNTSYSGDSALYITNYSGTGHDSNSYSNIAGTAYAWIGLDIAVGGSYSISYDWRCGGEDGNDYMRLALAPATALPEGGMGTPTNGLAFNSLPDGWKALDGGTGLHGSPDWSTYTSNLTVNRDGKYKLMVCWVCNNSRTSNPPAAIDNIRIERTMCAPAQSIRVAAISHDEATIEWTGGMEREWIIEYGIPGEARRLTTTSTETLLHITSLAPNTRYEARVTPICNYSDTGMATYITFTTCCSPVDIPYLENFDGSGCLQWRGQDVSINGQTLTISGGGTTYVMFPQTTTGIDSLRLYLRHRQQNLDYGTLSIGYMDNLYNETSFREIATLGGSLTWTSTSHDFGYDGPAPAGCHITLRYTAAAQYSLMIDTFALERAAGCRSATGLTATAVNSSSATLQWRTPASNMLWQVECGARGYTPFSGSALTTLYTTSSAITVSGLTAATDYDAYVRPVCGLGDTGMAVRLRIRTRSAMQQGTPTSLYADNITTTTARINFSATDSTASYQIAFGNSPAAADQLPWHTMLGGNHSVWGPLQPGTTYYYAVRSIDDANAGQWSEVAIMRTLPDCGSGHLITAHLPLTTTTTGGIMWQHYDAATLASADMGDCLIHSLSIEYAGVMEDSIRLQAYIARGWQNSISAMTGVADAIARCVPNTGLTTIYLNTPYHYQGSGDLTIAIRPTGHLDTAMWSPVLTAVLCNSYQATTHQVGASYNPTEGRINGLGSYTTNSIATLRAVPLHGYRFAHWGNGDTSSTLNLIVHNDTILQNIVFALDSFNITTIYNDASLGTVRGPRRAAFMEDATLSAVPAQNCHFMAWGDGIRANPRTLTITDDTTLTAFFALDTYQINIIHSLGGTTSGSGRYPAGQTVTATATPDAGYHFYQWNDGNTDNPRQFTATADSMELYAQFVQGMAQINVTCDSSMGIPRGTGLYSIGQHVAIYIEPHAGYHFVRWQNDGSATNRRTITANADITYSAELKADTFNVRVLSSDTSRGEVHGGGRGPAGTRLTLNATPRDGYMFVSWQDGSTSNPRTITISGDAIYTALFSNALYRVNINYDTAGGTVTGSGYYTFGDTARLTASAANGHHFTRWDNGLTSTTRLFRVENDTVLTAQFDPNRYMVYVRSDNENHGTTNGYGTYDYGTVLTISAHAAEGYQFAGWDDGNSDNPRQVTVTGNASYTATFEQAVHQLTVLSDNLMQGTVSGGGTFTHGQTATISAIPEAGSRFVSWSDGDTANPRQITVNRSHYLIALFTSARYNVSVIFDRTMGNITGMGTYNYGSTAVLVASPNTGYRLSQWNDGATAAIRSLVVTADTQFTALFARNSCRITAFSTNDSMGSTTGTGNYPYGDTAILTAIPASGYRFTGWSNGSTDNPLRITATSDTSFSASFAITLYTVSAIAANDTMGYTTGGGTYTYGTMASLTAIPRQGYRFTGWSDGINTNPRVFAVTSDIHLTAYFRHGNCIVTARSNDTLMGTVTGGGYYQTGEQATLTALPRTGCHFTSWNDGITSQLRTITVLSDTSLTALFELNRLTVNVSSNNTNLGIVNGGGNCLYGQTITLEALPLSHCLFLGWSDGNTDNPRQMTVTADISLTANFSRETHTINGETSSDERGYVTGSGSYPYGDTVYITAVGNYNYTFAHWEDGSTENPRRIIVTADETHTATFVNAYYTVTVTPDDSTHGFVHGSGIYPYNHYLTIAAAPAEGYRFTHWSDGNTNPMRSLLVVSDISLQAVFERSNGISEARPNATIYANNSEIVLNGVHGTILIYDAVGRLIIRDSQTADGTRRYHMPSTGVYIVKISGAGSFRVVVL